MCEPGYELLDDGTCGKTYQKFDQCAKVSRYNPSTCAYCEDGYMNNYG